MFLKKLISVVLCLVLLMASVVALIPELATDVAAATYRTAANGPSSSYKGSKYYQHYQNITLTGDGVTDTLALALSQLGYHEGASTSDMDGISSSSGNYTEFNYNMGDWGSGYTYEWCATFCSWALYQSHTTNQGSMSDWCRRHSGDSNYIWREVGCPAWVSNLKSAGRWKTRSSGYKPQPGDLIFFRSAAHIGMVVYSDSSYVYTIEGNTSDQAGIEPAGGGVFFKKYALSNTGIDGYGVLPYKTNSSVTKIDYSGANPTPGLYISNAVKYVYSTETGSTVTTNMPRFTMFEVKGIGSNGRLNVTYTANGTTVTGWVMNNEDRVIQLTHKPAEKVSMTLKCVDEAGKTLKTETLTGSKGASFTITPPAITGYTCTQATINGVYTKDATITAVYKTVLDAALDAAKAARYCDYTANALKTLRSTYDEAVAMKKNTSATQDQKIAMATRLQNAVNNNVLKEVVVSKGKKYTTSATERTDKWKDDGVRLTDGKTGEFGESTGYAGWNTGANGGSVEVVVDLGSSVSSSVYRVYTTSNEDWGVNKLAEVKVYVSNDNKNFTEIGATTSKTMTASDGTWKNYTMTVKANSIRSERYIKFVITAYKTHAWLEEVEVASAGIGSSGQVYINGINTKVTSGSGVVYTPAFGAINATSANNQWSFNIVAEWSAADNCYIVKNIFSGSGSSTPAVTLASNQILIALHNWENDVENPVFGSYANVTGIRPIKKGDKIRLTNVDVANATLGAAATANWFSVDAAGNETAAPVYNNIALNKDYTTSEVHASYPDEKGASLTDGKNASIIGKFDDVNYAAFHITSKDYEANGYASITVDLGAKYDLNKFVAHVASSYNGSAGIYTPGKVSVYVSDDNKTWTSAGSVTPADSNTNSTVAVTLQLVGTKSGRYVQYRFQTQTDKNWIMVAEVEAYGVLSSEQGSTEPDPEPDPDVVYGDVDNDGDVDSIDYLFVKRYCLGTYDFDDDAYARADINKNNAVDSVDYLLIKRMVLGTYSA